MTTNPMTDTFRLTIDTGNAAFNKDDGRRTPEARVAELARILRAVAEDVEAGSDGGVVVDVNGNRVGSYALMKHEMKHEVCTCGHCRCAHEGWYQGCLRCHAKCVRYTWPGPGANLPEFHKRMQTYWLGSMSKNNADTV